MKTWRMMLAAMLLGSAGSAAAQPPTATPAGEAAEACQQMVEQLTKRKNAQGLYNTTPGPSDAALAARVSAFRAAQEKALQQGTSP
jgi:hypothetical protein